MDVSKTTVSINKAINTQEVAVKEKHARTCILGTHHEKGAQTFWSVVNRLPLSSNAVLCWKFCHVFHKLLRDGHSSVLQDSMRYKGELSDMSRMWGHLSEGYGRLSSIYLKLLITKMEFHSKNPRFPGNLQMTDRQLEETGENDVNNFFQLTVEMFDYLECELSLFQAGKSFWRRRPILRLLFAEEDVPMVGEVGGELLGGCWTLCFLLFCWMLFSLSLPGLPADTLQGHRDRFHEQFRKLKELLYRSSNLQYFKRLIQIPQLPESPPNFLRASALSEHVSPVVVIPAESGSPDTEPVAETEDLVEMDSSSQQSFFDNKFDDLFGTSGPSDAFNFNSQNGMSKDERKQDMLSKSRAGDTGVKLEVNERILASCTDLMDAIKLLVLTSKDLQRDIVESGRGAASHKEFYAKNSRWTEGLISASKAVGWGATVLVDAADLVVQGKGKFEELMVCSHEIAASTAQLVAASKVKADKESTNLGRLQQASRGVNEATANVVASTKSGKSQIEEKDTMDFSTMTLTQIKRQEMDTQVRVLELENQLQKERQRLGGLRKKHYELAGVSEGWDADAK
eukprot:gi/632958126/ref/XP_007894857.1/ PREDICTED: huntingtin-interacting protein 1 [Callorhinchus milii]